MKEIKNPLTANIDRSNGNIEISIAKKYSDSEEPVFKKFMGMCAMNDSYAVETGDMNDDQTMKACGSLYESGIKPMIAKMEANLYAQPPKSMLAGLTEKQKKNLPPELKKAILEKIKKEGKMTEEAEAEYSKLLSEDDKKDKEVGPEGEMKKIEKPKTTKKDG
jgi:hypothetical protein